MIAFLSAQALPRQQSKVPPPIGPGSLDPAPCFSLVPDILHDKFMPAPTPPLPRGFAKGVLLEEGPTPRGLPGEKSEEEEDIETCLLVF